MALSVRPLPLVHCLDLIGCGDDFNADSTTSGKTGWNELAQNIRYVQTVGKLVLSEIGTVSNGQTMPICGDSGNNISEVATLSTELKFEMPPGVDKFVLTGICQLKYFNSGLGTFNRQNIKVYLTNGVSSQYLHGVYSDSTTLGADALGENANTNKWAFFRVNTINLPVNTTDSELWSIKIVSTKETPGLGPTASLGVSYWDGLKSLTFKVFKDCN